MKFFSKTWFLSFMIGVLLYGCSLPDIEPPLLKNANVYSGRFSVRVIAQDTPPTVEQGSYRLYVTPENLFLDIYDPLGNTVARLSKTNNLAELKDNQGNHFEASTLEELAENLFSDPVPISKIPFWIEGEGFSTQAPLLYDTLIEVVFDDWKILLTRFEQDKPNQIDISKASPDKETNLRFIIQNRKLYHETTH